MIFLDYNMYHTLKNIIQLVTIGNNWQCWILMTNFMEIYCNECILYGKRISIHMSILDYIINCVIKCSFANPVRKLSEYSISNKAVASRRNNFVSIRSRLPRRVTVAFPRSADLPVAYRTQNSSLPRFRSKYFPHSSGELRGYVLYLVVRFK